MAFEDWYRLDRDEFTAKEREWVRDVPGSVLHRQRREKPHLHDENLRKAERQKGGDK